MRRNGIFVRGPPKDHLCEIVSKLDKGFRSCHLSQLLMDGLWYESNIPFFSKEKSGYNKADIKSRLQR